MLVTDVSWDAYSGYSGWLVSVFANSPLMEQYRYLQMGYEDTLYRLDAIDHIAGRIAYMDPRVIHTRRNIMERPDDRIRDLLRRA
ncbi:hypothetical protein PIB30_071547 [Stylosanthes scabra]|uniref:Uncharacterized protein n=1 Tax=Stylosanthes scabra TaxID=79078 RepID=A0ABU6ZMK7_9FABA|nr:hypothetical protein [Stylosanthes scabra]